MNAGKTSRKVKCGGFSIVELIIAMVLGLVIMAVMLGIYQSNSQNARFYSANLKVQENGRFALDVMGRTVRMAGYDDPMTSTAVAAPLVNGSMDSAGALITQTGLKSAGDTLSVRYEGGAGIRDCQGQAVAADDWVTNMYAITTDNNLVCATYTNNSATVSDAVPVAEGVEDMRVLYGLDLDDSGDVNRYVRSQAVADWSQVISLRIAMLMNSIDPVLPEDDTVCMGCVVFNGSMDRLVRQEFHSTVQIRN